MHKVASRRQPGELIGAIRLRLQERHRRCRLRIVIFMEQPHRHSADTALAGIDLAIGIGIVEHQVAHRQRAGRTQNKAKVACQIHATIAEIVAFMHPAHGDPRERAYARASASSKRAEPSAPISLWTDWSFHCCLPDLADP